MEGIFVLIYVMIGVGFSAKYVRYRLIGNLHQLWITLIWPYYVGKYLASRYDKEP